MNLPDLAALGALVRRCAREELLPRFGLAVRVGRGLKLDGSLVTEADHAMQDRMQRELAASWPEHAFLGEELAAVELERLTRVPSAAGLWCLDPLDGTSNFAAGVPYFAVSLALLVDARPRLGLVYDPVRDECFSAARGRGAWLNGEPLPDVAGGGAGLKGCIAAIDFKRLAPALATRLVAEPPYGSQRNFGASSLDWCWLAAGRFHLYLHGGQKLWDYAAGDLILAEAGGRAQTLEGQEVFAFGLAVRSVMATRRPELFSAWSGWLAPARG